MSSSEDEIVLITAAATSACIFASLLRKKNKRIWIKEWRKNKNKKSSFHFLQNQLRLTDNESFKNFIRMGENLFQKLIGLVEETLMKQDTCMRKAIPVPEKLAATLRFLATGETFKSLNYQTKLSAEFLGQNIPKICKVLYVNLRDEYLKFPSTINEWKKIADRFSIRWQFPLCLGAVYGKHIAFRSPKKDGAFYRNYKNFDSIVLLALVDADCRILYCDVGCNGRISDGGVLRRSTLMHVIENANKYFPAESVIGENRKLPYVIVGDDAFPLLKNLMKPYPYKTSDVNKQIFNVRLSTARHTVEHTFGILANRFQVLQKSINLNADTVQQITLACCALHNFLLMNSSTYNGETQLSNFKNNITSDNAQDSLDIEYIPSQNVRNEFCNYFSNEGSVPWQYEKL